MDWEEISSGRAFEGEQARLTQVSFTMRLKLGHSSGKHRGLEVNTEAKHLGVRDLTSLDHLIQSVMRFDINGQVLV